MRTLLATALLGLMLAASPLALAQDSTEPSGTPPERPDDAAWTEDCPPDMMCAFDGDGENGTADEEPTYDGNCGGEVCAYGDEDCIECAGPVRSDDGATCMDRQQEGESCRDDVQYLDGRGPAGCENCRGGEADPISAPVDGTAGDAGSPSTDDDAKNAVPLPAVLVVLAALAAAVLIVRRA